MEHNFFPQRPAVTPTIYAYRLPGVDSHKGFFENRLYRTYCQRTYRGTTSHKQNQV